MCQKSTTCIKNKEVGKDGTGVPNSCPIISENNEKQLIRKSVLLSGIMNQLWIRETNKKYPQNYKCRSHKYQTS